MGRLSAGNSRTLLQKHLESNENNKGKKRDMILMMVKFLQVLASIMRFTNWCT